MNVCTFICHIQVYKQVSPPFYFAETFLQYTYLDPLFDIQYLFIIRISPPLFYNQYLSPFLSSMPKDYMNTQ